jgi:outer membrane lipoprotein-sorting protein
MDHGREVSSFSRTGLRFALCLAGASMMAASIQFAFAQGGETEVFKTTPSNPPPAAAAAAQAPAAQPSVAPASAAKAVSPVGGRAQWQAKAQPPLPQAEPSALPPPEQESEHQILLKINDYFNKMTNLEGTFIQTDPDNKQKNGKFYFAKPGKLLFDYNRPSRLKIISDGYYLAIEDYEMNTSDKYPLEMTPFRILLAEPVDLAKDANIVNIEQGDDTIVATLEDKKGDSSGRITLFFNKADMSLKEWIITDAQGLNTRIQVDNLEQNKRVSAELFEFSKTIGFHRE